MSLEREKKKGAAAQADLEEELSDQKEKRRNVFLDALNFNLSKNVEETKLPCQGRYQQKRKKSSPG